jgi:transcriptional regulator with XRE-family HTH domain
MKIVRACIYPKDMQCITGRSERYGRKLLNEIKAHFGKESYQFITSEEFAERSGVALTVIRKIEQGKTNLNMDKVNLVLHMFGHILAPVSLKEKSVPNN